MKVRVKKLDGMNFEACAPDNDKSVAISAATEVGGNDAGARPMELVLMGLGGCSGIDVALILAKSRQRLDAMEIEINAARASSPPTVFTQIHLHYILRGELDAKKVARAISLSMEKYCSVTRMLASTADITHDFEIVPASRNSGGENRANLL